MKSLIVDEQMANQPNYYELLGLEARQYSMSLSQQEVKAAYRRALLKYHPDKRSQGAAGVGGTGADRPFTVDDIALAYKTLSEPHLRSEYDRWRQSSAKTLDASVDRPHHTGLETVDLDDLAYDPEISRWSRECRCGDKTGFIVSEAELEKNAEDGELIIGCKGCSLWLRVLFEVEE